MRSQWNTFAKGNSVVSLAGAPDSSTPSSSITVFITKCTCPSIVIYIFLYHRVHTSSTSLCSKGALDLLILLPHLSSAKTTGMNPVSMMLRIEPRNLSAVSKYSINGTIFLGSHPIFRQSPVIQKRSRDYAHPSCRPMSKFFPVTVQPLRIIHVPFGIGPCPHLSFSCTISVESQ